MVRWLPMLVGSVLVLLFFGVLSALVWFANEWIVSTLATATVLGWLALWLVVVYRRERVRAMAAGALVAGGVYWLLALGPWFNVNIGPTLLTSRLLARLTPPVAAAGQQPGVYTSYTPVNYTTGQTIMSGDVLVSGSAYITTSPQVAWSYAAPQPFSATTSPSLRQVAGQWAFTWLFALAGGGFAWLLAWRTAAAEPKGNDRARRPAEEQP